eukprot:266584_1
MSFQQNLISKAKHADIDVSHLIFGYCRKMEQYNAIHINIIPLIKYIIVLYYWQQEYFNKLGTDINVSNDKTTITKDIASDKDHISGWMNTTYGKNCINSISNKIVKWTFKINKFDAGGLSDICMGIASTDACQNYDFTCHDTGKFYAFGNLGVFFKDQDSYCSSAMDKNLNETDVTFSQNDKISLILNLNKRQLITKINDGKENILWTNIAVSVSIKYILAVTLRYPGNSISLLDYKIYE